VTPSTLTESQRRQLDQQGFLVLPAAIDARTAADVARRFDSLIAAEGDRAGSEFQQEQGTNRLANLVDKDRLFDACWTHPLQLAAVAHVLEWAEFKLFSLNGRSAVPGQGHQPLHADWSGPYRPGEHQVCNSLWMLDDFTADNGATRVVPRSHRWAQSPEAPVEATHERHPDEVAVIGEAGTCVVFNAHIWHGGTTNRTDRPRRALHAFFGRREHPQQLLQREHLRPETISRLNASQRYLLDV
jgi:ectoine hydroxylase-related dioxygenase (phytanoyl-CoA dioxygenase family)